MNSWRSLSYYKKNVFFQSRIFDNFDITEMKEK